MSQKFYNTKLVSAFLYVTSWNYWELLIFLSFQKLIIFFKIKMIHGQAKFANVVLDVGSYHTYAGQAGLQKPRFASHSYLVEHTSHKKSQYKAGSEALNSQNYSKQIHSIFQNISPDGKVDKFHFNIQRFDKFVETILMDNLQLDGYSVSLLIAEDISVELDPSQVLKQRQKILDYLLEGMELTNIAFIKKPVLSTFAAGRTSSVVLDSGHSFSHCSIVEDGYCVFNKTVRFGGSILHNILKSQIQKKSGKIWKIKEQDAIQAFRNSDIAFHKIVELENILNQFQYISPKATMVSQETDVSFRLPDGHNIKIRRNEIVDPFVNYSKFWQKYLKSYSQNTPSFIDSSFFKVINSYRGLEKLVYNTIQQYFLALDHKNHTISPSSQSHPVNYHDLHRKRPNQLNFQDLISNVILAGGNINFNDISMQIAKGIKSKGGSVVHPPVEFNKDSNGNQYSNDNSLNWIGGSIVCNLPAFNHFWIKLSQWKQYGSHSIAAKSLNQDILLKNHTQLQESSKIGKKLQLISKKCA